MAMDIKDAPLCYDANVLQNDSVQHTSDSFLVTTTATKTIWSDSHVRMTASKIFSWSLSSKVISTPGQNC